MRVANIVRKNTIFFSISCSFILAGALLALLYPKGHMVLVFNGYHSALLSSVMRYFTHLGDGLTFLSVSLVLLLFVRARWGLAGIISFAVTGLVAQFFKRVIFGPVVRPHKFFEGQGLLDSIDGVDPSYVYSFPSGHATTAFAMFSLLAFISSGSRWQWLWGCMAVLVALSRVYLAQHFLEDIVGGAFLGLVLNTLIFWGFMYWAAMHKAPWDKPLIRLSRE